jgi:hypothetical protein
MLTRLDAAGSTLASTDAGEYASLRQRFDALASSLHESYRQRYAGASTAEDAIALLALIEEFLGLMQQLDQDYGPDCDLPLSDADVAVDNALRAVAAVEGWLNRLDLMGALPDLDTLAVGISLWAMRHECAIVTPDPAVNALARLANRAASRQDVAAAFGLMQGLIANLQPRLGADLERSNPERPWRVLHLNLAITGIKSGDEVMMRHAFAALNAGLPEERTGFYAEALDLAEKAGLPAQAITLIESELAAATLRH